MGEYTENKQVTVQQRVVYVLQRTRLSRRRMIWLLPQSPPLLSRMQVVSSLGLGDKSYDDEKAGPL